MATGDFGVSDAVSYTRTIAEILIQEQSQSEAVIHTQKVSIEKRLIKCVELSTADVYDLH